MPQGKFVVGAESMAFPLVGYAAGRCPRSWWVRGV